MSIPATTSPLVAASLAVIREGQSAEGAYLACPTFPTYRYSWFRDGAFIAEAMDLWGHSDSAGAFHNWTVKTIAAQASLAGQVSADGEFQPGHLLHTRYRADGSPGSSEWPNFQLDGLATWLWALERHLSRHGLEASDSQRSATRVVADYLLALWARPNFDCWEENAEELHSATLGAVYAGLLGAAKILGEPQYEGAASAVRAYLLTHGVQNGHFSKHVGGEEVDGNLLWLTVPYGVLTADHPISRATARKVRADLLDPEGGVHRYARDTYYGGGSWIILSAALAHDHLAVGDRTEAERLLVWIESQATPEGHLPEQTSRFLNDPAYLPKWEERWGRSACPLLWSHATYLTLVKALEVP
ncbi:MAG TPA: glycoside hydrolase family 15 protein [Trueperaceae bacterium]